MAGVTVIDQLIVKLGLDPKEFTKGQKAAARGVIEMERDVKRSTKSMSQSVVGFTGKLLGIATAAVAVKKGLGYVSDLSKSVRQLGIDSRNFDVAAGELKNFLNVSEMAGGSAEEARRSIQGITKAVYDLAYNGQISDSLIMLGRLGVQFQTTTGNARSFNDIALDTQDRIQGLLRSGTTRANANQMLLQAGFDQGLANTMLDGTLRDELARQQARRQITGETVSSATAWERSATNRDQAVAAATLRVLPTQAAAGVLGNDKIAQGAEYLSDATLEGTLEDIGNALQEGAKKLEAGLDKVGDVLNEWGDRARANVLFPKGRKNYENTIQEAAARHGIDPEILAGVLSTESNFNPGAMSEAGARGIAQLMPQFFPNAGKNPHEDIDTAAAYVRSLRDSFQKDGMSEDDAYYKALQSYHAGQSRVRRADATGTPLGPRTQAYPGKVLDYAAGAASRAGGSSGGNTTEVNIGKVDVVTRATNADGIASDFADATSRKFEAAQADRGMN